MIIRLFSLTQWWFSPAKQALFLSLLLCVFLLKPSIQPLIHLWSYDDNYNHGFFVLLISLYLWWKNSNFFHLTNPLHSTFSLLAFCSLYIIYLISTFLSIETAAYLTIPFLIALCLRIFSPTLSWTSVFIPAFFLFFALPVWDFLHAPLQKFTLFFCEYALYLFRIPFYVDGTTITTSEGYFDIETGCSGLRYLIVMLAFFYLKEKEVFSKNFTRSIALLFLTIFLALITNWIRVLTIILIGHQTKMQHSIVADHDLLGWVLFVLFFMAYLFISHHVQSRYPILKKITAPTQTSTVLFSNHRPFYFLFCSFLIFMLIPWQWSLSPAQKYTEVVEQLQTTKNIRSEVEFPTTSQLNPKDWLMIDQPKNSIDFSLSPNTFNTLITTLHQLSELHRPSDFYQPRITHFIEKTHPDLSLTRYNIDFASIHQLDSFFHLPEISAAFPKNSYQHTPTPIVRDRSTEKNPSIEQELFSMQKQVVLQSSLYIENKNNEKVAFQHKWQLLKMAVQGEIRSLEFSLYVYQCTSSCDWLYSQLETTANH